MTNGGGGGGGGTDALHMPPAYEEGRPDRARRGIIIRCWLLSSVGWWPVRTAATRALDNFDFFAFSGLYKYWYQIRTVYVRIPAFFL